MPGKPLFDPRKLMEQAIKVMRQSVHEPRKDDKASPKVGTLLCKADGTIETACRGELCYGDHAEFTVLEKKLEHVSLVGAIVYTTLEPIPFKVLSALSTGEEDCSADMRRRTSALRRFLFPSAPCL